ncbi:MAG: class I SAM-dependent methyltransferase [Sideroxyarcus sp.]
MNNEIEKSFADSEFVRMGACSICHSTNLESIGTRNTIHPHSRFSVQIKRCLDCHHWFTDPMPKAELLTRLYSESSLSVLGGNWASEVESNNRKETITADSNWIVKNLSQVKPGNFLEIGPGDGSLLRKAGQLGWNAFGVDLGNYASGFQVVSSISQLPNSVQYDAIVFQDVLEHVSDPGFELSNYADRLRSGAILFMTVPWSESKRARFGKAHWDMVRPLGHLHYFSKQSAKLLLESKGFEILSMETVNNHGSSFTQAKSIMRASLKVLLTLLRPPRWKVLNNRMRELILQARCFPDTAGDQLYIRAKRNI